MKLTPGKDPCPICKTPITIAYEDSDLVCARCGKAVWWLEWYASEMARAGKSKLKGGK
jgi:uncharacterized Zn finger protein (UPF0148 family)